MRVLAKILFGRFARRKLGSLASGFLDDLKSPLVHVARAAAVGKPWAIPLQRDRLRGLQPLAFLPTACVGQPMRT